MSDAMRLPGPAEFRARLHRPFSLSSATGEHLLGELVRVREGAALNRSYTCYAIEIALAPGLRLPQGVYLVADCERIDGAAWPLLLAPLLPGEDGRAVMEAVFHVEAKSLSAQEMAG